MTCGEISTSKTVKYDVTISFVRMIATVMIVVCHFMQKNGLELAFWFNVGVQIFLFMSGWLYGGRIIDEPIQFIAKNSWKILKSYWLYLLVMIPVYFIFLPQDISVLNAIGAIFCADTIQGMGHLWYIPYILSCYFLTPYLYQITLKIKDFGRISRYLIIICILGMTEILGTLYRSFFFPPWILCYFLGYFIANEVHNYNLKEKQVFSLSFLLCVLSNTTEIFAKYISQPNLFTSVFSHFYPFCHVALGMFLFFALRRFARVTSLCENHFMKTILHFSDRYSYEIYLTHGFLVLSSASIVSCGLFNPLLEVTIVSFVIILSALILKYVGHFLK